MERLLSWDLSVRDEACVQFLQWALPQLRMQWRGFRKVRGQVCKRLQRRIRQLEIEDLEGYRCYLQQHPEEWRCLDSMTRITISRFWRDRMVFRFLAGEVLPALAQQAQAQDCDSLKVWSAGAGGGEEPYTVALVWHLQLQTRFPGLRLEIVATDSDPNMLKRAENACYHYSSLKDLPAVWRDEAFILRDRSYCLKSAYRQGTVFMTEDIRETMPSDVFDLVLCRNLVFTYYDEALQRELLEGIKWKLKTRGSLVIGIHEHLPVNVTGFRPWSDRYKVYLRNNTVG